MKMINCGLVCNNGGEEMSFYLVLQNEAQPDEELDLYLDPASTSMRFLEYDEQNVAVRKINWPNRSIPSVLEPLLHYEETREQITELVRCAFEMGVETGRKYPKFRFNDKHL